MKKQLLASAVAGLLLTGCAAPNVDDAIRDAGQLASGATNRSETTLNRTDGQRADAARKATELLAQPLTMDGATQLAIANSPAFQAALASGWGEVSVASQRALPRNPLFTFERLRDGSGLELGRLLSIGLLDLVTLPQRRAVARVEGEQARVRLAGAIVDQANAAKQAWVKAVAAREIEKYAEQVRDTADASAELARRMQRAGNFTRLQAARQHLFYADATSRLAMAQQSTVSAREVLTRTLGLTDDQARALKLPDRLPDLPKAPLAPAEVSTAASDERLDLRLARLDGGPTPKSARWHEVTTDVAVGKMRQVEFTADEEGDWAFHCHKSHHTMNAMGHEVPTMIGVDHREIARKISKLVTDYMVMGERGMADMGEMEMPIPDNTAPMMGGAGPFGGVEMGGMFTTVKVRREQQPGDYKDPGWFKRPAGTVAYEFTGQLPQPARQQSRAQTLEGKPSAAAGTPSGVEVQIRKPVAGHSAH